jgi:WD40 repeat protein
VSGVVAIVDLERRRVVETIRIGRQAVTDVSLRRGHLAAAFADGLVAVRDLDAGTPLGHLPGRGNVRVAWAADGRHLVVAGSALEVWEAPDSIRPHLHSLTAGVSAVAFSRDGERAAVALGDGTVPILQLADARRVTTLQWDNGVVKDVSFSPDGRLLAAVGAGVGDHPIYDTATWEVVDTYRATSGRRVAWLDTGLLFLDYRSALRTWTTAARELASRHMDGWEMESEPGGGWAVVLGNDDTLWRIEGETPERIGQIPSALCVAPTGEDVLVGVPRGLLRLDRQGVTTARFELAANPVDLAVSADGQLVALGYIDGSVAVREAGEGGLLALLYGHAARVSAVAFSPDTRWLLTGGWDHSVRVWSLADLTTDPAMLTATLHASWGRDLDQVLTSPGP